MESTAFFTYRTASPSPADITLQRTSKKFIEHGRRTEIFLSALRFSAAPLGKPWFLFTFPLVRWKKPWYLVSTTIEVADAKKLWEPTGRDRSRGKSAVFRTQVWLRDGDGENISATVCGKPQLRYLLTMYKSVLSKSVGAPADFFILSAAAAYRSFYISEERNYGYPQSEGLYCCPHHPF